MKVGETILCKKNLHSQSSGELAFIKGDTYTIVSIDHDPTDMEGPYYPDNIEIGVVTEHCSSFSHIFSNSVAEEHWLFQEYFFTNSEVRKMKLEVIDGIKSDV